MRYVGLAAGILIGAAIGVAMDRLVLFMVAGLGLGIVLAMLLQRKPPGQ